MEAPSSYSQQDLNGGEISFNILSNASGATVSAIGFSNNSWNMIYEGNVQIGIQTDGACHSGYGYEITGDNTAIRNNVLMNASIMYNGGKNVSIDHNYVSFGCSSSNLNFIAVAGSSQHYTTFAHGQIVDNFLQSTNAASVGYGILVGYSETRGTTSDVSVENNIIRADAGNLRHIYVTASATTPGSSINLLRNRVSGGTLQAVYIDSKYIDKLSIINNDLRGAGPMRLMEGVTNVRNEGNITDASQTSQH
jgi:hypothetical protein